MILYSTHCPKCIVLSKKLEQKGISFKTETNDFQKLINAGITSMPVLEVDDKLLTFEDANQYINNI